MQKAHKRKSKLSRQGVFFLLALMIIIFVAGISAIILPFAAPSPQHLEAAYPAPSGAEAPLPTTEPTEPVTESPYPVSYPTVDEGVRKLAGELGSEHAILVDVNENRVLALKGGADDRIYPASMTKLMTLIVAVEHIENLDDTFTMTEEILAPLYDQSASLAGFQAGEVCTMRDLLYGAALPSGAEATAALAIHTAGSEEKFIQWMNEKCKALGLKSTHFVNTSGLHSEDHYSTVTDIALIMEYCLQSDICREIISTYNYTTKPTEQHPSGILLTNTMFARMYGTEVEGITIYGGKTGYTDEAGQCLVSYADTSDGHRYIAVTARGGTKWHPIFDSFKLYGIVTGTYPMDDQTETLPEKTEAAA